VSTEYCPRLIEVALPIRERRSAPQPPARKPSSSRERDEGESWTYLSPLKQYAFGVWGSRY